MKKKLLFLLLALLMIVSCAIGFVACGESENDNENKSPSGHVHDMEYVSVKEANCTESGHIAYWYCQECGKMFSDEAGTQELDSDKIIIEAKGHQWSDWTVIEESTCYTSGYKARTCSVCLVEERRDLPFGHTFSDEWSKDELYHWHAATCEHIEEISDKEEHDFINGVCEVCGWEDNSEGGLTFAINEDETGYIVTGYLDTLESEITIPATYKNLPVTGISSDAFKNCTILKKITAPASLTKIDNFAFSGCSQLSEIYFPGVVTTVGYNAFSGCIALKNVTIGGECEEFDMSAFYGCEAIETVNAPASIMPFIPKNCLRNAIVASGDNVPANSFSGAQNLTSVTLPDTITSIGNMAFFNCSQLEYLDLPAALKTVASSSFDNCTQLVKINFLGTLTDWCGIVGVAELMQDGRELTIQNKALSGELIIPDQVTNIPAGAFRYCNQITSVIIHANVEQIGEYAFANCNALSEVVIRAESVQLAMNSFEGCTITQAAIYPTLDSTFPKENLTTVVFLGGDTIPAYALSGGMRIEHVTIPDTIVTIEDNAFAGCISITEIVIPDTVKSIGRDAFISCSSLADVTLSASAIECIPKTNLRTVTITSGNSIPDNAFAGAGKLESVTLSDSVESIGQSAFEFCSSLNEIRLPESLETIGNRAFYSCATLTDILLPSSLTSIGESAFSECNQLSSILLPASLKTLGNKAFERCANLVSVTVNGVMEWGTAVFANNAELQNVVIGAGITEIGESAFYNCGIITVALPDGLISIGTEAFSACTRLTQIKLPETLKSLGERAFAMSSLQSVSLPDNLTLLGEYAFERCEKLGSVHFGTGLTSIGAVAFTSCEQLTTVYIPANIRTIEASAFSGCTSLDTVVIEEGLVSVGYGAFEGCSSLTEIEFPSTLTGLEDRALAGCNALAILSVPASVEVGNNVIENCTKLTEVSAPAALVNQIANASDTLTTLEVLGGDSIGETTDFMQYSALESVVIRNVSTIGSQAFYECNALNSIILENVKIIGENAFYGCGITELVLPSGVQEIGDSSFAFCPALKTVAVESGAIGANAFAGCSLLEELSLGAGVTSVAADAFGGVKFNADSILATVSVDQGNTAYQSANNCLIEIATKTLVLGSANSVIPADGSITKIGENAFYRNIRLTVIDVPASVEKIGDNAFYGCITLDSVSLPVKTELGENAFAGCRAVTKAEVSLDQLASFPSEILKTSLVSVILTDGEIIEDSMFRENAVLEEVILPDTLLTIGESAFYRCTSLKEITIPESTKKIAGFDSCSSLERIYYNAIEAEANSPFYYAGSQNGLSIVIGNSVKKIPAGLFTLSNVTELIIGENVETIGNRAFSSCSKLVSIEVRATAISDLTEDSEIFWNSGNESGFTVKFADGVTRIPAYFMPCESTNDLIVVANLEIADSVKEIGAFAFFYCDIFANLLLNNVETIGESAFSGCNGIQSITFSNVLKEIGERAFSGCSDLEVVDYKGSADTWCSISGHESLMSNSFDLLFAGKTLTNITLNTATEIPAYAFQGVTTLETAVFGDQLKTIRMYAFAGTSLKQISIPDSVNAVEDRAFEDCSRLTTVTIGKNVEYLGGSAFEDCVNLSKLNYNAIDVKNEYHPLAAPYPPFYNSGVSCGLVINIGYGVTNIPEYIFGFAEITDVYIPQSVQSIGEYSFINMGDFSGNSRTKVFYCYAKNKPEGWSSQWNKNCPVVWNFPGNNVDEDGYIHTTYNGLRYKVKDGEATVTGQIRGALKGNITIPDQIQVEDGFCPVTTIGQSAFYYCNALTNITIPNSVTSIGSYAFYNCSSLISITIPDGVTSIGSYAFYSCGSLISITIPDGVTSIGMYTFYNCSSLSSITIPNSVTKIDSYAFAGCNSLTSVTFENTSGWSCFTSSTATSGISISSIDLGTPSTAATYLTSTYCNYYWKRS